MLFVQVGRITCKCICTTPGTVLDGALRVIALHNRGRVSLRRRMRSQLTSFYLILDKWSVNAHALLVIFDEQVSLGPRLVGSGHVL